MEKKEKILIVDDEARMRKLIGDFLINNNFDIVEAGDGEEALKVFNEVSDIKLIILDVMMPKLDGYETLKAIRKNSKVPVILLTARGEENDQMKGFMSGADDYIQKPFSPKILVARINAILRRNNQTTDVKEIGGIKIDKTSHQIFVDDKPVEFTFKEFELIDYLIENAGIALTREKILNAVWNFDYFGDARTVDTHIKKVRAKLGKHGDAIKTLWGFGYKFEIEDTKNSKKTKAKK
ncbi:MAG: response regulator transcription factor [Lachnospiraceae bacterium]|nr:response regulator transcription factor [Lachnospiraceae bacterium]